MKDDNSMKSTVPSLDGSRFASSALTTDTLVNTPTAPASSPVSRLMATRFAATLPEESMVVDDRSHLSPAQMVEQKLMSRLRESSLPVSHLQMRGLVRARYEA